MRKKSGFSLMEMMIVLLITAVVAAATAPIISKKMVSSTGGDSPWLWAGTDHSIVYNVGGGTSQTANIGDIYTKNDNKPRLYIATNSYKIPQIAFKGSDDTIMKLLASNDSIVFSNNISSAPQSGSVAIGAGTNADSQNTTSIGYNAKANSTNATALGYGTTAAKTAIAIGPQATASANSIAIGVAKTAGTNALALGGNANAENATAVGVGSNAGKQSLAIGASSDASGENALAIGYGAKAMKTGCVGITTGGKDYGAKGDYSTAYGYKALASGNNSIAIGSTNATAYKSITIGDNNTNEGSQSIVIGDQSATVNSSSGGAVIIGGFAKAQDYSVSIGWNAGKNRNGNGAVSIGTFTDAVNYSTAIGYNTHALHDYSTAIGYNANTTASNQIVLGNASTTVYIPGNLVVGKQTLLGANVPGSTRSLFLRQAALHNGSDDVKGYTYKDSQWELRMEPDSNAYDNLKNTLISDRRLKNVGEVFKDGLAELKKLDVFNFTFKKDSNKTPMVGVMAQDLQKVFPNAVFKGEDGFLRIRWDEMFFSMINAIKELDLKITGHDKKLEELQKQNTELQKRLDKLEQRLDKLEKAGKKVK